jgi:hypothetical protein
MGRSGNFRLNPQLPWEVEVKLRVLAAGALVFAASNVSAQGTGQAVLPSGRALTQVAVRGAQGTPPKVIKIDYGQPHLRGRPMHTDSLVPLERVWRTGANEATALTTEVNLTLGGANVPAGEYTLYTLPSRDGWKLIISKKTKQWGTEYDQAQDLARVDVRTRRLAQPLESLTMWLIPANGAPARGELRIAWANWEISTDWTVK